jgi:GNAT superfamily N-acetyltransferase
MSVTIRFATPADAEILHGFIVALATYERAPGEVRVTPEVLRAQLAEEPPPFECLLAEEGGSALGFALFVHNYSTWLGRRGIYLEDLFVLPEHRGRGIGRRLLAEIARLAVARDCGRVEWAVLDWNEPALDFYRALGAAPLDDWVICRLTGAALEALGRA